MPVQKKSFGSIGNGREASLFILSKGRSLATFTDYGARLVSLDLPAPGGNSVDVILGLPSLAEYLEDRSYFGATLGRYANRIGGAHFHLDGREYRLAANDGRNHLHGGSRGFDAYVWEAEAYEEAGAVWLRFRRESPDGEEGYPGRLELVVTYGLDAEGTLRIRFQATTDAPTYVNLSNHAYFNLAGEGRGGVLDHELRLAASEYLPVDSEKIPLGERASVEGTPFDFRSGKRIGRDIEAAGGYDHCFVIDPGIEGLREFARLREPLSGREMRVATTFPGVQFYTGNALARVRGKSGSLYGPHGGLCLETQFFPDSPNKPQFPSPLVRPGERWKHETVFTFRQ